MTRLVEALHHMGLDGEQSLNGRLVKLQGERCVIYIVEAAWGTRYYTWCDDSLGRAVQAYADPLTAIQVGLRRAAVDTVPD